jgi:hypothetical protein
VTVGNTTKLIPKENLRMNLCLRVKYNPVIGNVGKYKIEDTYFIEWSSLVNVPDFKYHPQFNCWNKRNDAFYIFKIRNSIQKIELNLEQANDNLEDF